MIVVDANILIYALIESQYTPLVDQLRLKEPDWRTTALCLHEVVNVLATYQRRSILTLAQCRELLAYAQSFIEVAQCEVGMDAVLTAAAEYKVTGYDAQYVVLAKSLNLSLITEDRKLRLAAPEVAVSMQDYLAGK